MAQASTVYRFTIDVSHVDRGYYETLDVRTARHPSENIDYLLTRVIALALNKEEGLEFSKGLCEPDEPAIKRVAPGGEVLTWIEIGNPAANRLHKASKASRRVAVYTYKDPQNILRECEGERIHRADGIEITAIDPRFLKDLAVTLDRANAWTLLANDGELTISVGEESFTTTLQPHRLAGRDR